MISFDEKLNNLNKKTMDLKQLYREETNLEPYQCIEIENNFTRHYVNWLEAKINYTHCCESDSEQFPSFLYKHEGGLYFRHLEDTDITDQWDEYLKTR